MSCAVSAVFGRPVALTPRRGAPASRRASSLRCEAAGIKTGKAVWRGENTKEVGNGEGFETEFLFDLGGETPAQVKDLRFKKDSEVVTVTIPRPLGIVFEGEARRHLPEDRGRRGAREATHPRLT